MHIRTYNVLRILAREYEITALCFFRRAERPTEQHVRESLHGLRGIACARAFPIPQEHARTRLITDHLKSVLFRRAYTIFAYDSLQFRFELERVLGTQRFDLAHVDSLDLAAYLPLLAGLPVVCVHHNVESALLERRAATTGGIKGKYFSFQARLTESEERRWCPLVSLNVAVSETDRSTLQLIAPGANLAVVPNGVDVNEYRPGSLDENGIIFVGGHSWQSNREAMEYFSSDVLPLIRARCKDVPVTWVGRAPEQVRRRYRERFGIELTGYVDDIRPHVQNAACYVAPLQSGGGTRLKILDAWAMGKAVVSTSVGCEGLDAIDGGNILIRDTPQGFAEAVEAVLTDSFLRHGLGAAARRTAEERYDWEVIGKPMISAYRALHPALEVK